MTQIEWVQNQNRQEVAHEKFFVFVELTNGKWWGGVCDGWDGRFPTEELAKRYCVELLAWCNEPTPDFDEWTAAVTDTQASFLEAARGW